MRFKLIFTDVEQKIIHFYDTKTGEIFKKWLCRRVKVDLQGIRFSSAFVSFCKFFLLNEKVCFLSSAFLYVHIRTNQTVIYWTNVFRKKKKKNCI